MTNRFGRKWKQGYVTVGRVTQNYIALMSIGGILTTVGPVSGPAHQAVSFVEAAALTPGFDPLAKVAPGTLHRNSRLV